jgi:hypothetical protein
MGKLFNDFRTKFANAIAPTEPVAVKEEPVQELQPRSTIKRAYSAEPLSPEQRDELEEIMGMPGWEVLKTIHERTAEGFVSTLVETPADDEKAVLARHKLVNAAWIFFESVQRQCAFEVGINREARAQMKEIADLLKEPKMPDLNDPDTLNRLLDPLYRPDEEPVSPSVKVVRPTNPNPAAAAMEE